jgi:hypothetical protein
MRCLSVGINSVNRAGINGGMSNMSTEWDKPNEQEAHFLNHESEIMAFIGMIARLRTASDGDDSIETLNRLISAARRLQSKLEAR